MFSVFHRVTDVTPSECLSIAEIIDRVKNCPTLKADTALITTRHRAGILANFQGHPKGDYQDLKAALLPFMLPAGSVTERNGATTHQGVISFDIDEDSPEVLREFRAQVGRIPYALSAFNSASGSLTGAFALLVRVEIPTTYESIPKRLKKSLRLTADNYQETIYRAHHEAIGRIILRDAGVTVGTAGKSPKNARYLAHDPAPYINEGCNTFSLAALAHELGKAQDTTRKDANELAANIAADGWVSYCEQFATAKGYTLADGQKHSYLAAFAIAANLLGVTRAAVEQYADSKGVKVTSNCLSYPFSKYKKQAGQWAHRIPQQGEKIPAKAGQKLTDVLSPEQAYNALIVAPTGSGKSYFVAHQQGRRVIAFPTLSAVQNFVHEYAAQGAVMFAGSNTPDADALRDSQLIATTYSSFRKLCAHIAAHIGETRLFVDEAHTFSTNTAPSFQLKPLTQVIDNAHLFRSTTLLTGTPLYNAHPYIQSMRVVVVDIPQQPKKLVLVDATEPIKAAAQAIAASIEKGNFPILLFNRKSEAGQLGKLKAYLSGIEGIRYFSADRNTDPEAATELEQLIKTGDIPADVRGIVTTTVMKEGNNIHNPHHFDIIVLGAFHSAEIQQFSSRPRNAQSITVTIIRSKKRKPSTADFSPTGIGSQMIQDADSLCGEYELIRATAPTAWGQIQTEMERTNAAAPQAIPVRYNAETDRCEVDYLRLSNQVFGMERAAEQANDVVLLRNLAKYGIVEPTTATNEATATDEEREAATDRTKAGRATRAQAYTEALDTLAAQPNPLAYATKHQGDRLISDAHRSVLSDFLRLCEVLPNQAAIIKQMREIGGKTAKIEQLRKRAIVGAGLGDAVWVEGGSRTAIVYQAMRNALPSGATLTSEAIAKKVGSVLALHPALSPKGMDKDKRRDKYLEVARRFVEVTRTSKRTPEGVITMYTLSNINFEGMETATGTPTHSPRRIEKLRRECLVF